MMDTSNHTNDGEHHCEALVIHCLDFRFHEAIRRFVERELGVRSYDLLTIAGAAKHLTVAGSLARREGLLEDIDISIKLHQPKKIVLINHADCGAYGGGAALGSAERETEAHRQALREAAARLRDLYPAIKIEMAYARPNGAGIDVEPVA